jgi:flagellar biosynthesis protein FlhG
VIAITSGKGGVGKTHLAVNAALAAARMGHRVVLFDLDLGLANVDVLLNVRPRYHLQHLLEGKVVLEEVLLPVSEGLRILPGASGVSGLADLEAPQRERLIQQWTCLDEATDLVFVDTGAGIGRGVVDFVAAADDAVVIATPDPSSLLDAFSMLKVLSREPIPPRLHVLANVVSDAREARGVSDRLISVSKRFLPVPVRSLGYVLADPRVVESCRKRSPFLLAYPNTPASRCVDRVVRGLLGSGSAALSEEGFIGRLLGLLGRRTA